MSLFRRRKVADTSLADGVSPAAETVTAVVAGAEQATAAHGVVADPEAEAVAAARSATVVSSPPAVGLSSVAYDRSNGPFDAAEIGDDDERLALGGLRLAGREGMELRFEVEEGSQRVIAVTVGLNGSTVQLQVFAAPRSSGVWDEIRHEIAAAVAGQGGSAEERVGPLGAELLCRLPVRTEDGRTAHQPTRFAGVDGPRWFLRAVFAGPAALEVAAAAELEDVVRDVVVVRGGEAMAPRELIALALPPSPEETAAAAQAAEAGENATHSGDDLKPFERGPEITEVR
ncbi:MAG: DUF3710 domain-containing protein [Janthinobacterium lividum]